MAAKIPGGGGGRKPAASWLGRLHGSAAEAKARAAADAAQRKEAGQAANSIILNPNEVHGEYDAARALTTTLGGVRRAITRDDLAAFRHNIRAVQKTFRAGVRARQVLDLSTTEDRDKARSEIRMAVPVGANNGRVRFVTNAGPHSDVTRHHVTVDFLSYGAAASAGRDSARKMANWLRKEPLRYDCDCGRHRYWYRYITTIGGFNAGRAETGFPKIRNPKLHGVACKHVIRVMAEIESSGAVLAFLTRLLEKARAADDAKAKIRHGQDDAEALAEKQAARARDVQTTTDRAAAREAIRAKQALADAAKPVPPPKKPAAGSRKAASAADKAAATLAKQFGLTPEQVMALLAAQQQKG